MAEGGSRGSVTAVGSEPSLGSTAALSADTLLPADLPPEMFTGPGLLALADLLPVLTAYVDRDLIFRFVNRPYAEWLGIARKDILGRSMRAVLGEKLFAVRRPLLDAALKGERHFFAAT